VISRKHYHGNTSFVIIPPFGDLDTGRCTEASAGDITANTSFSNETVTLSVGAKRLNAMRISFQEAVRE
jgi:hypothetical protein